MADGAAKHDNAKLIPRHNREQFIFSSKLVETSSIQEHNASTEDDKYAVNEAKSLVRTKNTKRKRQSSLKDGVNRTDKMKQNSKSRTKGQNRRKKDEITSVDKYLECNSDIAGVDCKEKYWFENEVIFIPAEQRTTPVEYVVT